MKLRLPRSGCLSSSLLFVAAIMLAGAIMTRPYAGPASQPLQPAPPTQRVMLRSVAAFASISDTQARSAALFREAGRVIQHPRCLNCHPRTDRPTQADVMRPHVPAVTRGPDGGGKPLLRCSTCHQAGNFATSGVPGNPKWALAPIEQAWQGKSLGEICRQLLDPSRSHMSRAALLHHMTHDELVGWAWEPGNGRSPAPGTQAAFGTLIEAWLQTGAQCPA